MRKILCCIMIVIIAIIIVIFGIKNNKVENEITDSTNSTVYMDNIEKLKKNDESIKNIEKLEKDDNINNIRNTEEIENIKKQINVTADADIYNVEQEQGGRKILQVKSDVQFYVDWAGIAKNSKPEENELNQMMQYLPENNGIWISKQSRKKFIELLNNNELKGFTITKEGYLETNNYEVKDIAKKLVNMIESNKLYIINITGVAYQRDYITGEIVEYPFEQMEPFQIIEPYEDGNKIILEVTTNRKQKLTDREILETIVQY